MSNICRVLDLKLLYDNIQKNKNDKNKNEIDQLLKEIPLGSNYTASKICSIMGIWNQVDQVFDEFEKSTRTIKEHIDTYELTSACKVMLTENQILKVSSIRIT